MDSIVIQDEIRSIFEKWHPLSAVHPEYFVWNGTEYVDHDMQNEWHCFNDGIIAVLHNLGFE